jgi:hypothetical protein
MLCRGLTCEFGGFGGKSFDDSTIGMDRGSREIG